MQGHAHSRFRPVEKLFRAMVQRSSGGAALCAYVRGEPVLDLWGGARDDAGTPWQRDTACVAYSTTKGVIATALHVLADRGLIAYDAPVARYWPEFAQAGKADITVRQVLCHRAGLFDIRGLIDDARSMLDWQHMVHALAAAPAQRLPARSTAYQALTWGYLVGELIRRVSGRELPAFVRDELAQPLGLDGLFVGGADVDLSRAARLVRAAKPGPSNRQQRTPSDGQPRDSGTGRRVISQKNLWRGVERTLRAFGHPIDLQRMRDALAPRGISRVDFSSDEVLRAVIPAANGMFTARSLARLYAALAGRGQLHGTRLLSEQTLAQATQVQGHGYDQVTLFNMRWRLGYHRVVTLRGVLPRAFGHFGWGGSGAWADPERELALGFVVNTGSGTPIGDLRITRLSSAFVRCAAR